MEVILAKSAGFCFGVKRAVDMVYGQIERAERERDSVPIYTYGPIIHNEEVVKDLEEKGVKAIEDWEALQGRLERERGIVVIRSHGVGKEINDRLEQLAFVCLDATCPFVKRIHRVVERESKAGKKILVIGDPRHPEVKGIVGWSHTPATVIGTAEEAENFTNFDKKDICLVSQTTFNYNKFQELVEIIENKGYNINVVNTICNATEERQTEAGKIASQVDAMIVIGGTHSSNSRKLYEICKKECEDTCFIQTLADLKFEFSNPVYRVGITAGASTPNNIIEEVQNYVRINF